jgi:hypothetical protein
MILDEGRTARDDTKLDDTIAPGRGWPTAAIRGVRNVCPRGKAERWPFVSPQERKIGPEGNAPGMDVQELFRALG